MEVAGMWEPTAVWMDAPLPMKGQAQTSLHRPILSVAALHRAVKVLGCFIHIQAELTVANPQSYVPYQSSPVEILSDGASATLYAVMTLVIVMFPQHRIDMRSTSKHSSESSSSAVVQNITWTGRNWSYE